MSKYPFKTLTIQELCKKNNLEFITTVDINNYNDYPLEDNEYYSTLVTDIINKFDSPHVVGFEPIYHWYMVGIEKPSGKLGCYLSKNFYNRNNIYRGPTLIVKTDNPENFALS